VTRNWKKQSFFVDRKSALSFNHLPGFPLGKFKCFAPQLRGKIMRFATRLPIIILLVAMLSLTERPALTYAQAQQNPYPNFPFTTAYNNSASGTYWLGGDSAYGLYYPSYLNCPVSLWVFSDTFLTPPDYAPGGRINPSNGYVYKPNPNISPIVGNTIAIVANSSTNFVPAYFYGANSTPSNPKPFFQCS